MIPVDSNILSDGENIVEPKNLEGACDDPSEKGKSCHQFIQVTIIGEEVIFDFMELFLEIKIKKLMVLVMECLRNVGPLVFLLASCTRGLWFLYS